MAEIKIGNKKVGEKYPTYIIAEAGINHNGSLEIAKKLVDVAVESGADAVKFQKRNLKKVYVKELLENPEKNEMGVEYIISNLKKVNFTDYEFNDLIRYIKTKNIEFLCSPWDVDSVDFLEKMKISAYKIGSPDMTNFLLLEKIIKTKKPIIISTGMSTEKEIKKTIKFLKQNNANFAVMHCRSTYPSPYHNIQLNFISKLKKLYPELVVGYSGHERGIAISEAAVVVGADIIEKHLTLDRTMKGPDHATSLEPQGFKKLVRDIHNIEKSMGNSTRYLSRGEYNNRIALAKSLVTTTNLKRGEKIKKSDLTTKSPAKGISPQELYNIIGLTLQQDVKKDQILQWRHIKNEFQNDETITLKNWVVVVRFSDIIKHNWGNPSGFEFRINGEDINQKIDIGDFFTKRLTVHAPEQKGYDIVDPSSLNETKRKQAEDLLQLVIDKVRKEIKPHFDPNYEPMIVIHPGGISQDHQVFEKIDKMNKALEKTISNLNSTGVQLLIENMPPLPWIFGGQRYHNNFMNANEISEYCKRTGQKICYDISHAKLWCNYAKISLKSHMKKLMPYIAYLHVADAAGLDGEGLQIGEGDIEWESITPLINKLNVPLLTEIWRGHEKNGFGFKEAARKLKKILEGE